MKYVRPAGSGRIALCVFLGLRPSQAREYAEDGRHMGEANGKVYELTSVGWEPYEYPND